MDITAIVNMASQLQVMNHSFAILILLFCGVDYHLSRAVNITTTGDSVDLICTFNSTEPVTWFVFAGSSFIDIFSCPSDRNNSCLRKNTDYPLPDSRNFTVQQNVYNSIMHIISTSPVTDKETFKCEVIGRDDQIYRVSWIDPNEISTTCPVALPVPGKPFGEGLALQVNLSCGHNFPEDLESTFSLEQFGQNKPVKVHQSSQNLVAYLPADSFMNLYEAYCEIYFPGINVTQRCHYPKVIKNGYTIEGNDIIIECDHGLDNEKWQLYSKSGAQEDIMNRSWSRIDGGSLLLRGISTQDEGKVVVCRTNGVSEINIDTYGFAVIPKLPKNDNRPPKTNTSDITPDLRGRRDEIRIMLSILLGLTYFGFLVFFGVWCWMKIKKRKKSGTTVARSSALEIASRVPNNVEARGEGDTTSITNITNSAHNPTVEPPDTDSGPTDVNGGNRRSNNDGPLYATLEEAPSSPRPLRQEHPDASLNHPEGSHGQCYETIGDPNKGVSCSYDLGEYADVSFHGKVTSDLSEYSEVDATQFRGTAPPDDVEYYEVGNSSRGKEQPDLPDRTSFNNITEMEVDRDNISELYAKVKKHPRS